MFSAEQKAFIKSVVPQIDPERLTDDDLVLLEEKIGDRYNQYCMDNAPPDRIRQCEEILSILE